jgi:hypothetical protein
MSRIIDSIERLEHDLQQANRNLALIAEALADPDNFHVTSYKYDRDVFLDGRPPANVKFKQIALRTSYGDSNEYLLTVETGKPVSHDSVPSFWGMLAPRPTKSGGDDA